MTHRSLRLASLLVVPMAVLALASPAHAQKKKAPADPKAKCEQEVKNKVRLAHQNAKSIDVAQTRDWQESSKKSGYGGTATAVTPAKTVEYEWTCTYDSEKGKVLNVNVQKTKATKNPKEKKN